MADPYCLAMVLSDAVHQDSTTGKSTILGTFSTISSAEFPTRLNLAVYFAITDADGEYQLQFRIVDSQYLFDESDPVFEATVPMQTDNPLAVYEGVIRIAPTEIPRPGVYHCELLLDGDVLMARRLVAIPIPAENEDHE